MAKVQKPKKGVPPENAFPSLEKDRHRTPSADYVGLNFRVPEDFAWEFKQAALSAKMKQNQFLYYLLELHQKQNKEAE